MAIAAMTDWRTIQDEKKKYNAYLCSREWGVKREAVRQRCYGFCERCRVLPMNAVHHLTYEHKYDEPLEDLQAICTACHEFTHGKSDIDPKQYSSWLWYVTGTFIKSAEDVRGGSQPLSPREEIVLELNDFCSRRQQELYGLLDGIHPDSHEPINNQADLWEEAASTIVNMIGTTFWWWCENGCPRVPDVVREWSLQFVGCRG